MPMVLAILLSQEAFAQWSDVQAIRNGKIAKTYPVQNWLSTLNQ
jgi:hypothetical protein